MSVARASSEQPDWPLSGPVEAAAEHAELRTRGLASREQAARYRRAGRAVLTWVVAYVALRVWVSSLDALAHATLITAVWFLIAHRSEQAFRAMTFVAGSFVLAATTAIAGVALIAAADYWDPGVGINRISLLVVAAATFLAAGAWDAITQRAARSATRVLVVGGGSPTMRLLDDLRRDPETDYEVIAVVDDARDQALEARVTYGGPLSNISDAVRRFEPDLVVVAVPRGRPQVFAQLLSVADAGFQVVGLPEIYESAFGRLPVEDLTSAWFMSVLHAYNRPANRLVKRCFDVVVALVGMVVTLPLLPLIVVVVKRTRGPLLYRQRRLGEHGQVFTILKFRSMRSDAEAPGEARWAGVGDPRVIRGGRWMRLLRVDELPQLWNVLRGEMSIVGPRPERPEFIEELAAQVPFWTQRHLLKPGITGWAQIRAGYAADALGTVEKLSYDLWYLRHRSLLLDSIICMRTIPRMLALRGAR